MLKYLLSEATACLDLLAVIDNCYPVKLEIALSSKYMKVPMAWLLLFFQCALAPFKNLPQEIESLKTVLEMKNDEINKLRSQNIELQKKVSILFG